MSGIARRMLMAANDDILSVTLDSSGTKTTDLSSSYEFNYGSTIPTNSFVVVVVTARSGSGAGVWDSITDSAGNVYTEAVEGTQSNNLTFTAIYYSQITNSVDISTVITASATAPTFTTAQHYSIFVLTGVNTVDATYSSPASSTSLVPANATTSTGKGIAIHAVSTGFSIGSVNNLSEGFILQTSLVVSGCQLFTATSVFDQSVDTSVDNTFDTSISANWASVMALFT
jgi:hypothetical protein